MGNEKDNFKQVMRTVVETYGIELLNDARRTNALLMDYAPRQVRERKLIFLALQEGIGNELIRAIGKEKQDQKLCVNHPKFIFYYTKVFKFEILEDGSIQYRASSRVKGKTINQYSFDEYDANLRLALYDNSGSRVVVLDPDLNEIGKTSYLAKGETMYSSRFIGTKAYLVTYLTTDPLYVIDLSDPRNPAVLGELKIPGYSTYLHPYDENHLIGIGMETEENIVRNSSGKIIRTTSQIVGMKMALFDVSDVSNPIQISDTVIGDRRTTSAILTNPKALLFSKEKELIAIPINNFAEDFSISNSTSSYSSIVRSYTSYNKPYIAEGYAVYKINLEDGFSLKGIITHENTTNKRTWQTNTKLLRGVYIDDNLFTVSESAIKVNSLDDLTLKEELQITQN